MDEAGTGPAPVTFLCSLTQLAPSSASLRRSGGPTRRLPRDWWRSTSAPPPPPPRMKRRTRTGTRRRAREGGSWRRPSPRTPTRRVSGRRGQEGRVSVNRPLRSGSGGDASALTRTGQYVSELFQSGAVTCLICIASVRRTQAVSGARHPPIIGQHIKLRPLTPVPPPAGVELRRLLLPLPPPLHPEVGQRLGLPRVLRDR